MKILKLFMVTLLLAKSRVVYP